MGPYQQFRMNYDEEPIEEEAPESVKKEQLKNTVKVPFASFIDQKMIKNKRICSVIEKSIEKEM